MDKQQERSAEKDLRILVVEFTAPYHTISDCITSYCCNCICWMKWLAHQILTQCQSQIWGYRWDLSQLNFISKGRINFHMNVWFWYLYVLAAILMFLLLRQLLVLAVFDRWKQSLIIEVLCEFFFNDFPMWFFRLTSSRAELKLMNIGPAGFHHILWDWFEQSLTFDNIIEMWYHFIPVHWTYF